MAKHRRRPRHTTMTETARRASEALGRMGILAHPGVISPKGGGGSTRIVVVPEPGRVRIGVSSHGHQELLIYGQVSRLEVLNALRSEFGMKDVSVRDTAGLWEPD